MMLNDEPSFQPPAMPVRRSLWLCRSRPVRNFQPYRTTSSVNSWRSGLDCPSWPKLDIGSWSGLHLKERECCAGSASWAC